MLNPERGDASLSDQHFNPKQACHNSIIPYYSTKPQTHYRFEQSYYIYP
ncbi:hypothetical protein [Candidatus Symbiopectobacterium sp.]|nr:hypothetical protein [Candidatus Symbiopectobacterium sp.]